MKPEENDRTLEHGISWKKTNNKLKETKPGHCAHLDGHFLSVYSLDFDGEHGGYKIEQGRRIGARRGLFCSM